MSHRQIQEDRKLRLESEAQKPAASAGEEAAAPLLMAWIPDSKTTDQNEVFGKIPTSLSNYKVNKTFPARIQPPSGRGGRTWPFDGRVYTCGKSERQL